jgi:glycosyltransferase involved in cell wall biosynthesis
MYYLQLLNDELLMKISIAVRTKFHAFQLAQQLHNKGVLHKLYTSFYGKILHKDNRIGFDIPLNKVEQNLLTALCFYGFDTQNLQIFQYFGHWVANQIKEEDLIISFPMISLPILKKARILGIQTIISHASAHTVSHKNLLLDAYQKAGLTTKPVEKLFSKYRQELMQEEYEMADFIQIPSTFVQKTFIENNINLNKLLCVPLGVDLRFFNRKDMILPKKFRIIYVGQLSIRKGLPLLLMAFCELNLPNAELCLIGALTEEVKIFLKKFHKNINYLGILPQTNLINELNNSSVFVINSIEDGFGQVIPQAMACGLPIICTENTGSSDLVENGETGFVIPIHDKIALQEKILYFYENSQEVIRMGEAAQKKVSENYTWEKYGEKCFDLYKKIIY